MVAAVYAGEFGLPERTQSGGRRAFYVRGWIGSESGDDPEVSTHGCPDESHQYHCAFLIGYVRGLAVISGAFRRRCAISAFRVVRLRIDERGGLSRARTHSH